MDVIIAKNKNKAMLVLSIKFFGGNPSVRIAESIFLYLDDNTIIKCADMKKFDAVDDVVTTIYYLTDTQLTKLKNVNINKIRYTLKCFDCQMSSREGKFSASNKASGYGYDYSRREKVDFPSIFKQLFD